MDVFNGCGVGLVCYYVLLGSVDSFFGEQLAEMECLTMEIISIMYDLSPVPQAASFGQPWDTG